MGRGKRAFAFCGVAAIGYIVYKYKDICRFLDEYEENCLIEQLQREFAEKEDEEKLSVLSTLISAMGSDFVAVKNIRKHEGRQEFREQCEEAYKNYKTPVLDSLENAVIKQSEEENGEIRLNLKRPLLIATCNMSTVIIRTSLLRSAAVENLVTAFKNLSVLMKVAVAVEIIDAISRYFSRDEKVKISGRSAARIIIECSITGYCSHLGCSLGSELGDAIGGPSCAIAGGVIGGFVGGTFGQLFAQKITDFFLFIQIRPFREHTIFSKYLIVVQSLRLIGLTANILWLMILKRIEVLR